MDLIGSIWRKESLPEDWKTAIICVIFKKIAIHKKGDTQDCNNYRSISLLNVTYKILSNCILSRIKDRAEEIIGNYQGGFRMGRSTIDQIFILRQVFQNAWEYNKELQFLFIDFQKAYDCIHRESVMKILKDFQFPNKLINCIMISIMETKVKVKVGDLISDPVLVKSGLRQGDALSPILFNLVLERVIREININNQGFKLQDSSIELLAYADDIVLLGESQDSLKNIFLKLEKAAAKVGLQCNEGKTAYMCVERRKLLQPNTLNI
ncbi:Reverse transcriptase domain [Cinara cedri]|uniref:Reverse transcriptase domain n=1 Tax=Cinara cedri TaxID=506608 RepID=A0A5E4N587_9HEMI|nr:Reverse transcriptase domain [Cinara cedri]